MPSTVIDALYASSFYIFSFNEAEILTLVSK